MLALTLRSVIIFTSKQKTCTRPEVTIMDIQFVEDYFPTHQIEDGVWVFKVDGVLWGINMVDGALTFYTKVSAETRDEMRGVLEIKKSLINFVVESEDKRLGELSTFLTGIPQDRFKAMLH